MAKCTGRRFPMQVGYKVDECNHKDCPYRTETITNADRFRAMSDEEQQNCVRKLMEKGIKCAATFAALALSVCAGCGVCAMASGGGCAAAVGTLAAVVGCNAALGVMKALK